jgi:hypothetical protein
VTIGFLCIVPYLARWLHAANVLALGAICNVIFCWTDIRFVASFDRMDPPHRKAVAMSAHFLNLGPCDSPFSPLSEVAVYFSGQRGTSRAPERSMVVSCPCSSGTIAHFRREALRVGNTSRRMPSNVG